MLDLHFTYSFRFPEGILIVENADSYKEAEEAAVSRAFDIKWSHTKILSYKADRI